MVPCKDACSVDLEYDMEKTKGFIQLTSGKRICKEQGNLDQGVLTLFEAYLRIP